MIAEKFDGVILNIFVMNTRYCGVMYYYPFLYQIVNVTMLEK